MGSPLKTFIYLGWLLLVIAKLATGIVDCDLPWNSQNSYCLEPEEFCLENSSPPKGLDDSILADYIVAQHNTRRSTVAAGGELQGAPGPQPATSCMNKLQWDGDLAKSAQNWANQCKLKGYPDRAIDNPFERDVGQNIH